jgi:hypothetical protein|tara:strand:+ start:1389 stop:1667 length:279 start_codon:yes stop_codon:yes gene_type:complete
VDKEKFKERVTECGDAVITYRSTNSRKLKYNVCTLDFTTPHIQRKHNRAKESKETVLLFCWDTDSYRLLRPANVTSIVPLNAILKNKGRNEW